MARRLANTIPLVAAGIRARAAYLASGFAGYRSPTLAKLEAGIPFPISATDAWAALNAVAPDDAREFLSAYRGPWPWGAEPWFEFDPRTGTLQPLENTSERNDA